MAPALLAGKQALPHASHSMSVIGVFAEPRCSVILAPPAWYSLLLHSCTEYGSTAHARKGYT